MATTRRKVVGTATFTYNGTAVSLGVTSIPAGVSPQVEVDTAAAFGDEVATHVPRNLATLDTFQVECIYEGVAPSVLVGKVVTVAIAATFRNGVDADGAAVNVINESCACTGAEYGSVEVDGDRKATVTFTFQPVGGADRDDVDFSAAAAASSTPSGNGG